MVLHVKETMRTNFLTLRNVSEAFRVSRNGDKEHIRARLYLTSRSVNYDAFQLKRNDLSPARRRTDPPRKRDHFPGTLREGGRSHR